MATSKSYAKEYLILRISKRNSTVALPRHNCTTKWLMSCTLLPAVLKLQRAVWFIPHTALLICTAPYLAVQLFRRRLCSGVNACTANNFPSAKTIAHPACSKCFLARRVWTPFTMWSSKYLAIFSCSFFTQLNVCPSGETQPQENSGSSIAHIMPSPFHIFTNSPTGHMSENPGVDIYQQPGPVRSPLTSKVISCHPSGNRAV